MRIIAGEWRGRPLVAPEGRATRPTSDRVREALFSMLASRIGTFEGLKVIDLFAGSGALGLEALSRGAAHCIFVDSDRNAVAAIQRNLATFGAASRADVRAQGVEHAPAPGPLDLVFLDAEKDDYVAHFAAVLPRLRPGGLVLADNVVSHDLSAYQAMLRARDDVETVTLPIERGIEYTVKLG